jgi:hypothetical protein
MIGSCSEGRPAKLLERIESSLQYCERAKDQQREKDDLRELDHQHFISGTKITRQHGRSKPGCNEKEANSGDEHNQHHEIDNRKNKTTQLFALLGC